MSELPELVYCCPYCGESNTCLVDSALDSYQTIEDCFICCRPIELQIDATESGWQLSARTDSD